MSAPSPGSQGRVGAWTVLELLRWTSDHFGSHGIETPRLDAEVLLAHALGVDRLRLYVDYDKPVGPAERGAFRELVQRRASERVPVSQLVGGREFWSLPLEVTADVLTPRPDSEALVQAALDLLPDRDAEVRVLDLGTGSGAIALAIASERPAARIIATDVSEAALAVAGRNAEALGLSERVQRLTGSLFEPVADERFDLVVSNPPYLRDSERGGLPPELAHEPAVALFAGPEGTEVLREVVAGAPAALVPGGGLAVEIAPDQAKLVSDWCERAGLSDVRIYRDLGRRPRALAARGPA